MAHWIVFCPVPVSGASYRHEIEYVQSGTDNWRQTTVQCVITTTRELKVVGEEGKRS